MIRVSWTCPGPRFSCGAEPVPRLRLGDSNGSRRTPAVPEIDKPVLVALGLPLPLRLTVDLATGIYRKMLAALACTEQSCLSGRVKRT